MSTPLNDPLNFGFSSNPQSEVPKGFTKLYRVCQLGFWSAWKPYARLTSSTSILHPGMHVLRVWPEAGGNSHIVHADRFELR